MRNGPLRDAAGAPSGLRLTGAIVASALAALATSLAFSSWAPLSPLDRLFFGGLGMPIVWCAFGVLALSAPSSRTSWRMAGIGLCGLAVVLSPLLLRDTP